MMKKFLCPLLLLASTTCMQGQTIQKRVQRFVDSVYAANPEAVGFLVDIEAPGQHISWNYAVGYRDRITREKLMPDQPVLIASNTKPYVAASILKLVEQGKLSIEQSIKELLTAKTEKVLSEAGYHTDSITLKQLLSHTSCIQDYVDESYFSIIGMHKEHEWTRDEQITRAANMGAPLASPGDTFRYADVNYLLLTEILEQQMHAPYYEAMRSLLNYKELKLLHTWFAKFEMAPAKSLPRAHQYWDQFSWDTYDLDPSWDLYGGGGMIATVKDMAMFFQLLFNGKVIKDKRILQLMHTDVPPNLEVNYCLGIRKISYAGLPAYNHGGGLGTDVIYIPKLNATISVAALEAEHRPLALEISKEIVRLLSKTK